MGSAGASRAGGGRLVDIGRNSQLDAHSIFLKRWPTDFSLIARLVLIISGGTLLLLPLTAIEALSGLPMAQTIWGWKTAALVAAAALMPGASAYLAYATLQKVPGAARAWLTLYLSPLYAAVVAAVFLGEAIKGYHVQGSLAILPGIYLASRAINPKNRTRKNSF